jgi:type II secretory ATPase GspE/PulE/Tfp pilus assembly ATPase PilB-like protein/nucleotide-binding universal stress UspA family protein
MNNPSLSMGETVLGYGGPALRHLAHAGSFLLPEAFPYASGSDCTMVATQRILIPVDLSESNEALLGYVRKTAERSPTELHLLHVIASPRRPRPVDEALETRREAARHQLELRAHPLRVDGLAVVLEVRSGRPAHEIVAYAREQSVDEICMTTHARTGLAHTVLGGVAEQVIRHAPCPVLVIGPPQPGAIGDHARQLQAAHALAASFDSRLNGPCEETWKQMEAVVGRKLGVTPSESGELLDLLQSVGVLDWYEQEQAGSGPCESYWSIDLEPLLWLSETSTASLPGPAVAEGAHPIAIDLLARASDARASDVHLDPKTDAFYEVGFRIDGRVEHYCDLDRGIAVPLIQQIKVLAGLDIAEPFLPQEGRLHQVAGVPGVEVRITSAPVQGGPAMALRLHRRDQALMPLEELGLATTALEAVAQILHAGAGLVLVTGPTGSGKTTTIYSQLQVLAGQGRKIVSIEDPIEYPLPFVRQLGVDPKHNLTMTEGLRTILRMDPDIVAVSEIRDVESAEIAMRAASSGRFVFSTLHTRDAASTITAVRDLHIDNRSMAANLTGIIAQRLVRRLCRECAEKKPVTDAERTLFAAEELTAPAELLHPVGCTRCRGTGYYGRVGIFEVVQTQGPVETAIAAGAPEDELRGVLRTAGTPSLLADALVKVAGGITCVEEAQAMKWV